MSDPKTYENVREALEEVVRGLLPGKLLPAAEIELSIRLDDIVLFLQKCHQEEQFSRMRAPGRGR